MALAMMTDRLHTWLHDIISRRSIHPFPVPESVHLNRVVGDAMGADLFGSDEGGICLKLSCRRVNASLEAPHKWSVVQQCA